MGRNQLRLLKFAIQYPGGWHGYGRDRSTVSAVNSLAGAGFLEISDTSRQFRLALPAGARAAVDARAPLAECGLTA